MKVNLIGLATAALVTIGFFVLLPNPKPVSASSLPMALRDAISEVNTLRIVTYGIDQETGEKKAGANCWFVRDKGYARIMGNFFQIDDGVYYWEREFDQPVVPAGNEGGVVTRTRSHFRNEMLRELTITETQFERKEDEDITIDGKLLYCYSMKNLAPFEEGPQRCYVYVTSNKRIFKSVTWMHKDGKWNFFNEERYFYNVEVDESVFVPPLENLKVIDLDEEFDALTNLENSLFRKTVDGFEYAVHRAHALEGGGVMMFVSVRPSETNPRQGFSARIYDASPQQSGEFRIELGTASHDQISAQWFYRVSRDQRDKWNHINNGTLAIQETFSQRDESDMSIEGFAFKYADLTVEIENWQSPMTLEDAAREVYRDQQRIPNINGVWLDTGVYTKDLVNYGSRGTVTTTTEDEYVDAVVKHLGYWRGKDSEHRRNAIERAISKGTVQITTTVPGLEVSNLTEFADADLARAAKKTDLIVVNVADTSVSDEGLKCLGKLDSLEDLDLQNTDITDAGLEHIARIMSLRRLDVRGTGISQTGLKKLMEANPNLKVDSDFE